MDKTPKEEVPADPVVEQPVPVAVPTPNNAPSNQSWPDQTPQPAQIQYVVAQQSLDGIAGMLVFWIVVFSLTAITMASTFFAYAFNPELNSTGSGIVTIIFAPLIAAACLYAVFLIASRKKLAIKVSIAAIGIMVLQSIISTIVISATASTIIDDLSRESSMPTETLIQATQSSLVGTAIGAIVATLVYGGLVALYFLTSKRVKQTLVK
jgi:hypothetical protein